MQASYIPTSPDQRLKCLLVNPRSSVNSLLNFRSTCDAIGAKAITPPLGLLTVAALLPKEWEFRLVDLNAEKLRAKDLQWADLVGTGGMLCQQNDILEIIDQATSNQKYIVVGGAHPSTQPELYKKADVLVLGEGELAIPEWLSSWREGKPEGIFSALGRYADIEQTPPPRYDLIKLKNYAYLYLQMSRGCPFSCEFCALTELFGRQTRYKAPKQVLAELEIIRHLGYTGQIDFCDDNFIGDPHYLKNDLLPAIIRWNEKFRKPFFFSTVTSLHTADDDDLLNLMRQALFRYVFIGIESPDEDALKGASKRQNIEKPIVERICKFYQFGMQVLGSFVIGFDQEKPGIDRRIFECIEEGAICIPSIGLLVALPNTRLWKRLHQEGRLFKPDYSLFSPREEAIFYVTETDLWRNTTGSIDPIGIGLNFVTLRNRDQIIDEFIRLMKASFSPEKYLARVVRASRMLSPGPSHRPGWRETWRNLRGFVRMSIAMTINDKTRRAYWKTARELFALDKTRRNMAFRSIALFIHFEKQVEYIGMVIEKKRQLEINVPGKLEQ